MSRPAQRLKILDLRDTEEIGGPGKTILETFRAIDATRYELHVGVFPTRHQQHDSAFVRAARQLGMPVHLLRSFNQFDPRLVWRLAALVRKHQFDIVHAHEAKSDVITVLASRLCDALTVTTAHGWIGNSAKQRALMALDKRLMRAFDRVIVVSRSIRDDLQRAGVGEGQLRLVHNAIVLDNYRRTHPPGFLVSVTGRHLARPVISSIGRISPEKGHGDLVEALATVAAAGHRFSVVLAGDGPHRVIVEERVRALGLHETVHFVGYVSEPWRLLQESDLMVLPSHTEGLPNAALEALAMEVPVLATRVGGTPEVIVDGETGRLVAARAPAELAAALMDFLVAPQAWQRMAVQGRQMVEQRFDFQDRTRTIERIYDELAVGAEG